MEFPRNSPLGNLAEFHNSTNYVSNSFVNTSKNTNSGVPRNSEDLSSRENLATSPFNGRVPLLFPRETGDIGFPGGVSLRERKKRRRRKERERERRERVDEKDET